MNNVLPYDKVILDIEGTVCPISFVHDQLFPYFVKRLPSYLSKFKYPLSEDQNVGPEEIEILNVLRQFPETETEQKLSDYINGLVNNDVKDSTLKQFQGIVWAEGYNSGEIMSPLYEDAIQAINYWSAVLEDGIYIYSSGSVQAQKLMFGHVKTVNSKGDVTVADMNGVLSGYFDTTNAGSKLVPQSYTKIATAIGYGEKPSSVLFLSDNPMEVHSAREAGLTSYIVVKPGNKPLSEVEKEPKLITDFEQLFYMAA